MKPTTQKQLQRQWQRKTLAEIETKLHPCPTVNGLTILHQHVGQKIVFSAWKGDNPANNRSSEFSRYYVLNCLDFYSKHSYDLQWLTEFSTA